jgi:hypothetical protein
MPITIEPLTPRQIDKAIEKLTNQNTPCYGHALGAWRALYNQELKPPLRSFEYSVAKRGRGRFLSWASVTTRMGELGQPRNNWDFDDIARGSSIKPSYYSGEGDFRLKIDELNYDEGVAIDIDTVQPVLTNAENLRKISSTTSSIASNVMDMIYTVYTRKGTVRLEHVDTMERPDTKKSPDITIKPMRWVGRK